MFWIFISAVTHTNSPASGIKISEANRRQTTTLSAMRPIVLRLKLQKCWWWWWWCFEPTSDMQMAIFGTDSAIYPPGIITKAKTLTTEFSVTNSLRFFISYHKPSLIWFSTCNTDLQKKVSLTKLKFLWLIVSCCNLLFTLRYEGTKKRVCITRRTLTFILIWSARELLFITDESVNTNERSVCTGLAGCSLRQQMQWNQ